jgi:hypothetical protein
MTKILNEIKNKTANPKDIVDEIVNNPVLLSEVLEGINADEAALKYGCLKVLNLFSERKPILLYPHFELFVKLLDSPNNIIKWNMIVILANLVCVDKKDKFENIRDEYFSLVTDKTMITAANVISHAWKIAIAKPESADQIVKAILKVEQATYEIKEIISPECRNVAIGHAIVSLGKFYHLIEHKKPVVTFIKKQLTNTRKPVVKKAERFLRKNLIE